MSMPSDVAPLSSCCRPGRPLAVYLLRYEDSFESDRYQLALRREREVGTGGGGRGRAARGVLEEQGVQ